MIKNKKKRRNDISLNDMSLNDMSLNNILITGGLGFIGSFYARLMINSGYNVVILDKQTYAADIRRIEDIRDEVKLYIGDICDRDLVKEPCKKIVFYDCGILVAGNRH